MLASKKNKQIIAVRRKITWVYTHEILHIFPEIYRFLSDPWILD